MQSATFDYDAIKNTKEFAIKRYQNAVYKGQIVNGERQGMGVMIYSNGRLYEGQWENDKRN